MKALSIRQPWAWAIIHAGKDIENRSWPTRFRGPILIHAAKGMTDAEYQGFLDFAAQRFPGKYLPLSFPLWSEFERGGIIGRARIIDCVADTASPWFMGPYGLVLANPEPLPFRPLKGKLGFFDVEMSEVES